MLRRIRILGAIAALAVTGSASAAEPAAMDPARWDGAYAGVFFGGSVREASTTFISQDVGFEHPSIGLVAGYRLQMDRVLFGLEADFGTGGQTQVTGCPPSGCAVNGSAARTLVDGHLRGTAGVALSEEFALFVAGGLAVAYQGGGVYSVAKAPSGIATEYDDDFDESIMLGYSVGGGVEYRPLPGWTLRTEVLYDVYDGAEPATVRSSAQIPGCCSAAASASNLPFAFDSAITARMALLHRY